MSNRTRRGRGEGSIEELPSGKFRVVVSAGHDPETHKRVKITRSFDTKGEALAFRDEMLRQQRHGELPLLGTRKMTVNAWLDTWIAGKRVSKEAGTIDFYERIARKHIRPRLGAVVLSDLNSLGVRGWLQALDDGGVSRDQQRKARDLLATALNDAVENGIISRNPAAGKKVPRPGPVRKEVESWTAEESVRFLVVAEAGRYGVYYRLALDTGARPGELLGLHWPEVDLLAGKVRIKQSLEELKGKYRLKAPKSKAGLRTIGITPATVGALLAWRERMRSEGRDVERGPVFVNQKGGWLSQPTLYRRSFLPALRKAKLRPAKPYVTRHTSATLLLRAGVSLKAVSRRLGHEDEAVTLKHYLHVLPDDDQRAVGVLQGLFGDCPTASHRSENWQMLAEGVQVANHSCISL